MCDCETEKLCFNPAHERGLGTLSERLGVDVKQHQKKAKLELLDEIEKLRRYDLDKTRPLIAETVSGRLLSRRDVLGVLRSKIEGDKE